MKHGSRRRIQQNENYVLVIGGNRQVLLNWGLALVEQDHIAIRRDFHLRNVEETTYFVAVCVYVEP